MHGGPEHHPRFKKKVAKKPFDGMIVPYNRDVNEETALFVDNASKPLFEEGRRYSNFPLARSDSIFKRITEVNRDNLRTRPTA